MKDLILAFQLPINAFLCTLALILAKRGGLDADLIKQIFEMFIVNIGGHGLTLAARMVGVKTPPPGEASRTTIETTTARTDPDRIVKTTQSVEVPK